MGLLFFGSNRYLLRFGFMNLITKISTILSVVFQPLFMPFIAMLFMLYLPSELNNMLTFEIKKAIILLNFIFTIFFPLVMFVVFLKLKWITDIHLTVRKERVIPTFISLALFVVLYFLMRDISELSNDFLLIYLGSILGVLIANIVTLFWKISIHGFGVFGVVGAILAMSSITNIYFPLILSLCLLIAILVGISRLVLKRHTPLQVILGSLLGLTSPSFFFLF